MAQKLILKTIFIASLFVFLAYIALHKSNIRLWLSQCKNIEDPAQAKIWETRFTKVLTDIQQYSINNCQWEKADWLLYLVWVA